MADDISRQFYEMHTTASLEEGWHGYQHVTAGSRPSDFGLGSPWGDDFLKWKMKNYPDTEIRDISEADFMLQLLFEDQHDIMDRGWINNYENLRRESQEFYNNNVAPRFGENPLTTP